MKKKNVEEQKDLLWLSAASNGFDLFCMARATGYGLLALYRSVYSKHKSHETPGAQNEQKQSNISMKIMVGK